MAILVDPEKSQTDNLMYLLEQANIPQTVKNDIEGYSCLARDKTINGKSYNTELHLHILPNSPTHLREKMLMLRVTIIVFLLVFQVIHRLD